MRAFVLPSLLVLCIGLAACEPIVMIPGGALEGSLSSAPTDWSFTDSEDTVVLETRPEDPYSVNVWGVAAAGQFFIAAGDSEGQWAKNILEDPRVRLKIGDALYELQATPTDDPADLEAFLAAVKKKYDFEPDPDQRAASTLFRLGAR